MINQFFQSLLGVNLENYPAKASTARLVQFEAYKLGWFIHWNMPTYIGVESYLLNGQNDAPHPNTFAYNSQSIANWANSAELAGNVDYAYLTTKHQVGFQLYPNTIKFNSGNQITYDDSYRTGRNIPYYQDYGVSSPLLTGMQQDIVGEYMTTFKEKGIEPGLYYNIGKDINIRAGFDTPNPSSFDGTGNYRDYWNEWKQNGLESANSLYPSISGDYSQYYRMYIDYVKQQVGFLLNNYDCNLLWFDAVAWFPRVALRELYEHVKSINSNCLISMNIPPEQNILKPSGTITNPPFSVSSDEIYLFQGGMPACDIVSYEASRISTDSNDWLAPTMHNGVEYYIPKEVSTHTLGTWFWNDSATLRTNLQSYYDDAISKGMRLNIAPSPNESGVIEQDQINALSGIVVS